MSLQLHSDLCVRQICDTPLSLPCSVLGLKVEWSFFGMYLLYLSHLQDSELNELRKTIELLKKQNAAAQAAINGVINTPELNCKGKNRLPAALQPLSQCRMQPCY